MQEGCGGGGGSSETRGRGPPSGRGARRARGRGSSVSERGGGAWTGATSSRDRHDRGRVGFRRRGGVEAHGGSRTPGERRAYARVECAGLIARCATADHPPSTGRRRPHAVERRSAGAGTAKTEGNRRAASARGKEDEGGTHWSSLGRSRTGDWAISGVVKLSLTSNGETGRILGWEVGGFTTARSSGLAAVDKMGATNSSKARKKINRLKT